MKIHTPLHFEFNRLVHADDRAQYNIVLVHPWRKCQRLASAWRHDLECWAIGLSGIPRDVNIYCGRFDFKQLEAFPNRTEEFSQKLSRTIRGRQLREKYSSRVVRVAKAANKKTSADSGSSGGPPPLIFISHYNAAGIVKAELARIKRSDAPFETAHAFFLDDPEEPEEPESSPGSPSQQAAKHIVTRHQRVFLAKNQPLPTQLRDELVGGKFAMRRLLLKGGLAVKQEPAKNCGPTPISQDMKREALSRGFHSLLAEVLSGVSLEAGNTREPKHGDPEGETSTDNPPDGPADETLTTPVIRQGTLGSSVDTPGTSNTSEDGRAGILQQGAANPSTEAGGEFEETMRRGRWSIEKGYVTNAEKYFNRALGLLPLDHRGLKIQQPLAVKAWLATITLYHGQYRKAEQEFLDLASHLGALQQAHPDDCQLEAQQLDYLRLSATCLNGQARSHEAMSKLKPLLHQVPSNSLAKAEFGIEFGIEVRREYAISLARLGLYEDAMSNIKEATAILYDALGRDVPVEVAKELKMPYSEDWWHDSEPTPDQLEYKVAGLLAAEATINLEWGRFGSALKQARLAFKAFQSQWPGTDHPHILECAILYGILQFHNGQMGLSNRIIDRNVVKIRKYAGREHPKLLEVMNHVAKVYIWQGRPVPAASLTKDISRIINQPEVDDIRRLESKSVIAESQIFLGHYRAAEETLCAILDQARQLFGNRFYDDPVPLRYTSLLALALGYAGKTGEAHKLAVKAFLAQAKLFLGYNTGKSLIMRPGSTPNQDVVEHMVREVLGALKIGHNRTFHPSFLSTLQSLARIDEWTQYGRSFALDIYTAVTAAKERQFGSTHLSTLETKYLLGIATRVAAGSDPRRLEHAASILRSVYSERNRLLGDMSQDTQSALRELLVTEAALWGLKEPGDQQTTTAEKVSDANSAGELSDIRGMSHVARNLRHDWAAIEAKSVEIRRYHVIFGPYGPEALRSIQWLLKVQLRLGKMEAAVSTADELLARLQDSGVRRESLVQSLVLQRDSAEMLASAGLSFEALEMFRDAVEAVSSAPDEGGLSVKQTLEGIRLASQQGAEALVPVVSAEFAEPLNELYALVEQQEQRGLLDEAGEDAAKLVRLVQALSGKGARETVDAEEKLERIRAAAKENLSSAAKETGP